MSRFDERYAELVVLLKEAAVLGSCSAVLGWDEQTGMPPGGSESRATQLSMLAGLIHQRTSSPRLGEVLEELEGDAKTLPADDTRAANIRDARRNYNRATKLPQRLVEEISRTVSLAQQQWIVARKDEDFPSFLPWLEKMIGLKREEAQAVGYGSGHPYDALLDEYEPGATTAEISAVFASLKPRLVSLVERIRDSVRKPRVEIVERFYPVQAQRVLSEAAARTIGFDFERGRLDRSAHPFCSGVAPGDVRLTTRFADHHFNSAFFGTLHEAGHGLYEQGLDPEQFGLGCGTACSLGIHESQSRMWENFVGRSKAFWTYFYPGVQQAFPDALNDIPLDDFYFAVNDVRPSFIRVEADEATYNLHIMLRFELEQQLVTGSLAPKDVPEAWNAAFHAAFGMTPPTNALGCLQDVHWSAGLLGYFPTYALGNMYAAQLFRAAQNDLEDLEGQFARGDFRPLKTWLHGHIHQFGRKYSAGELVRRATGSPLSAESLISHLEEKFGRLYDV